MLRSAKVVIALAVMLISSLSATAGTKPFAHPKASAQGKTSPKTKSTGMSVEAEFSKMIAEYYEAWSTLDPDKAQKYYSKDSSLVFFDIAPLKYNSWQEYSDGVKKAFMEPMISGRLVPNSDVKIVHRGNVVWTTLTFHLSAKPKAGGALELECRHTAIWEKIAGKWLIVHEHVSAPLPG